MNRIISRGFLAPIVVLFTALPFSLHSEAATTVTPSPYIWSPASSYTRGELEASVTSCFTALVFVPRSDVNTGLAPNRTSRGYAFRLGTASPTVGSWRSARATAPRVLLVAHSRGALEIPGGKRDKGEMPAQAAARELREETGVILTPPLSLTDAVLVREVAAAPRYPRWLIFVRIINDAAVFDAAIAAAPTGAKGFPSETWGNVGAPLWIEGTEKGAPRLLAAMPPWQAEMLIAALVAAGILEANEALEVAKAADKVVSAGGARRRKADELNRTLTDSVIDSIERLKKQQQFSNEDAAAGG